MDELAILAHAEVPAASRDLLSADAPRLAPLERDLATLIAINPPNHRADPRWRA